MSRRFLPIIRIDYLPGVRMVTGMVIENSEQGKQLAEAGSAKGGRARASVLTPEERSEIARKAVQARWAKAGKLKTQVHPQPQVEAPDAPDTPAEVIAKPVPSGPFSMFRGELQL